MISSECYFKFIYGGHKKEGWVCDADVQVEINKLPRMLQMDMHAVWENKKLKFAHDYYVTRFPPHVERKCLAFIDQLRSTR